MGGQTNKRLLDIDRAKGFGIALVVWGHLFKAGSYGQPEWMAISRGAIYEFHMPLFMYLSGFVFFYTQSQDRYFAKPGTYVAKRFDRLMVPFLAFGAIVVLGKYLAGSFGPVDDRVDNIADGFAKVVLNTPDNPSISIWYLLVLFVYSLAVPFLWRASGKRIWLLVLLGLLLWLLPDLPQAFYILRILLYFVFFAVGGYCAIHRDWLLPLFKSYFFVPLLMLPAFCWLLYANYWSLLVCGLVSIPAFHGLFMQNIFKNDLVFLTLGTFSMAIYLMNTIFIGLAKILYVKLLAYDGAWFIFFTLFVFLVGILGPMLVKVILDLIKPLRPVARYLD